MKRCVVLMVVLAMTVMLFAGCGRPAADVSGSSQLPETPPSQEEPIEKMPKAPRAVEAVPAEELMSANPVDNAAGFSIWLKDSSGSFLQELPYSGQLQRGQVIAALPGEDGACADQLGNHAGDIQEVQLTDEAVQRRFGNQRLRELRRDQGSYI